MQSVPMLANVNDKLSKSTCWNSKFEIMLPTTEFLNKFIGSFVANLYDTNAITDKVDPTNTISTK
jgi:hypothetical protein